MLRTLLNGGLLTVTFIRISIAWHWIISVSPVSNYSIFTSFYILIVFLVATSTAVERVFSQGRHLLSFTRNRLSASSIRAFLCLGSWGRNDLIFYEDVLAAVRENSKRKRELDDSDIDLVE